MVLKILDTVIGNGRVELNHYWVQLSPLLTLPLYILHSLSILFTLHSLFAFPFYTLYSIQFSSTSSLLPLSKSPLHSFFNPLPTFPQMTSPPSLYIHPLSTSPIWVNSFFNPSLPSTYISSFDYTSFDTPTLYYIPFLSSLSDLFAYHKKLL